jgi:hypothetical protein
MILIVKDQKKQNAEFEKNNAGAIIPRQGAGKMGRFGDFMSGIGGMGGPNEEV